MKESLHIYVDAEKHSLPDGCIPIAKLRRQLAIQPDEQLMLDVGQNAPSNAPEFVDPRDNPELVDVDEEQDVQAGGCYWTVPRRGVVVIINQERVRFRRRIQTGASIKRRANIPLEDVLFLEGDDEDLVITNETRIKLKFGMRFHSAPPANYGATEIDGVDVRGEVHPQPGGWQFFVVPNFALPKEFSPRRVRLLIKLPPLFPDAAPDMFWVSPQVRVASGAAPQATSIEQLLGEPWQRFSWHLQPGGWRAGVSTLRDFLRCVRARLERRN